MLTVPSDLGLEGHLFGLDLSFGLENAGLEPPVDC